VTRRQRVEQVLNCSSFLYVYSENHAKDSKIRGRHSKCRKSNFFATN